MDESSAWDEKVEVLVSLGHRRAKAQRMADAYYERPANRPQPRLERIGGVLSGLFLMAFGTPFVLAPPWFTWLEMDAGGGFGPFLFCFSIPFIFAGGLVIWIGGHRLVGSIRGVQRTHPLFESTRGVQVTNRSQDIEDGMEDSGASNDDEEKGVPASRGAHLGTGLFATVFGGVFGGGPLFMFISLISQRGGAFELVFVGLFVSPFLLIGGGTFILGVALIGAGIIGYPLMKIHVGDEEEEEEGTHGEPVSTAFTYTGEDDILEQIRDAQAQPALPETGEKAPTLGWGMAPASASTTSEERPKSEEGTPTSSSAGQSESGDGGFWSDLAHDEA